MFEPPNAIQLRVSLVGIEPEIWRRLVVPIDWTLRELHLALQAAFGWTDSHLHEFVIGGLRYGDPSILMEDAVDDDPQVFDEGLVRLRDFRGRDVSFAYIYDFGDDWQHLVRLEDYHRLDPSPKSARCTAGARARPPEDVGGPPGYEHFLGILADPKDPEYAGTLRWCGGHFDPEWFDLERINTDLRNALRANARRPGNQPKPRKV